MANAPVKDYAGFSYGFFDQLPPRTWLYGQGRSTLTAAWETQGFTVEFTSQQPTPSKAELEAVVEMQNQIDRSLAKIADHGDRVDRLLEQIEAVRTEAIA